MSGGGSQVTAATPWSQASPYLTDIMGKAQQLYGSLAPNYMNPAANFGYGQTTGAVGNVIGGNTPFGSMATSLAPGTTSAIQQQLSGTPDYSAVKGALDAANQQTWDSFNNQFIPQLNQSASFLGNPSGAIKDLNWATANIGKNMDLNAQQQYLGLEEAAKQRQAQAAGLGANIAQGAGAQTLAGANLFGSLAQMPNQNLADYANTISTTGGKFGTSTESMKPGGAATAANIIGGLTAGTGLLNNIFGTGGTAGTSLASKVGGLFGGGAGAIDTSGAMAGALGDIGSTTSAGLAGTAGDVAAANDAWLAGQAGSGAASGLGAGATADAAGLGSTAAGADAAGTAGATGAAGGATAGSGAALSPALGGSAALAIGLAPAIAGMATQPYKLGAAWWQGMENAVKTKGLQSPEGIQLASMAGNPHDPNYAQALQMAQKYGIQPLNPYLAQMGMQAYGGGGLNSHISPMRA